MNKINICFCCGKKHEYNYFFILQPPFTLSETADFKKAPLCIRCENECVVWKHKRDRVMIDTLCIYSDITYWRDLDNSGAKEIFYE